MELTDLVAQIPGFEDSSARDKIRVLGWYLHNQKSKEVFGTADIKDCFDRLHMTQINISMYLSRMAERSPPDLVKVRNAYKLSRNAQLELDTKYGSHQTIVHVSKLLSDLVGRVQDVAETHFLHEAISCYRIGAYRACVVMMWNLAYSHLVQWVIDDNQRLARVNAAIPTRYPRRGAVVLSSYEDFLTEFKESEVVEICGSAGVINGNLVRILREKSGKRNIAAHPSSILIVQSQADDVVTDLVNNVVLALA